LPARALLRATWRLIFRAASLVVILDHQTILRGVGVSAAAFWWDCGLVFDEVAAAILSCAPTPTIDKMELSLSTSRAKAIR